MTVSILPVLPVAPNSIARPGTFAPEADAFFGSMGAFREAYNANVPGIQAIADLAPLVASAANYKGPWASLAGALAIPASVTHAGKPWLLTEGVANVAAHEPGVSSKWVLMAPPQNVELINTVNAAGVASVEWTNFDTLAATYAALRIVGEGIRASANGQLLAQSRYSGAWGSTLTFGVRDLANNSSGTGISHAGQLRASAAEAVSFDMDIAGLGIVAPPLIFWRLRAAVASGGSGSSPGDHGSASSSAVPTVLQGLRLYPSTGTLTGTFRLYGVRK